MSPQTGRPGSSVVHSPDSVQRVSVPIDCEVLVVGAGLAGLACAVTLHDAGVPVGVVEAEPEVGGRVRSRVVDGFVIDRGFQLLNPAYPAAPELLDLAALQLQAFPPGVAVATGDRTLRLLDPRRAPLAAPESAAAVARLVAQDGPRVLTGLTTFAGYAMAAGYEDPVDLKRRVDVPAAQAFSHAGLRGPILERIVRPFLAGVLGEAELATSRRFVDLVLRSFLRGTPAVPAAGMGAISQQLAARLPDGALAVGAPFETQPLTNAAARRSPAVVVDATARETGQTGYRGWHALTTFWFGVDSRRDARPARDGILHVDGDSRGPVVNTAVQSLTAPSYAPPGWWLVQATVLGAAPQLEAEVRRQCQQIYRVPTDAWDLVDVSVIPHALPVATPPLPLRRPVQLGERLFACGDTHDTPSIQGALVSGRRTATAVLVALGRTPAEEHRAR